MGLFEGFSRLFSMLSILIPTHEYYCDELVMALVGDAKGIDEEVEIIVCSDASSASFDAELQRRLSAIDDAAVRFIRADEHLGPARTRNLLARESRGDLLLFIDADAELTKRGFLARHLADAPDADVVCGALMNPASVPPGHELRMRYERAAEKKRSAEWRNLHPYENFTPFNVLIHRRAFEELQFDERCKEYGYEDALYGLQLKEEGISILHTDNALIHRGIDTNESFLRKTETALRTLSHLGEPMQSHAGASRMCRKLGKWGLLPLLRLAFRLSKPFLLSNLTGKRPNLRLFSFYKLGYYALL